MAGTEEWSQETAGFRPQKRFRHVAVPALVVLSLAVALLLATFHDKLSQLPSMPGRPFSYGGAQHETAAAALHVKAGQTLKITVFSDLHLGEAEATVWGPEQDRRTLQVMDGVLDAEAPDVVVVNGDLITGDDTQLGNGSAYVDRLVAPMARRAIPWASVYGNHDHEFNLDPRAILDCERAYQPLSLTRSMVAGPADVVGVTNYFVPVYHAGQAAPAAILWFFDSRGGKAFQRRDDDGNEVQLPGLVDAAVTEWFVRTSRELDRRYARRGEVIPSLAFVHIPVSAMRALQETGVDGRRAPGINDDVPLDSQRGDEAFLEALVEAGVLAVFSGHDHGNDWCMPYTARGKTVFACFGRHTGYGGYGHWMRGSRQILLDSNGEIDTWVRLEDGDISGQVQLNATYGQDVYPEVKKAFTSLGVDHLK